MHLPFPPKRDGRVKPGHDGGMGNASVVIPGRRVSAGPGIQMQARRSFMDSGFAAFDRAPE
jgi:hypothetical protein